MKKHIQKTTNKTLCGINITKNNCVVDINKSTCKKCNLISNNICDVWDDIGLLDKLPHDRKKFVANMFEKAKDIMLDYQIHTNEEINVLIFPIIYKVGKEIDFNIKQLETIFNEVRDCLNTNKNEREYLENINVDFEQLFVYGYSKKKIKQLISLNN